MSKPDITSALNYTSLDTCGLRCPIPIMRTKREISKLTSGSKLLVIATDPSFKLDCMVFVGQTGHKLLHFWQEDEKFYFLIQNNTQTNTKATIEHWRKISDQSIQDLD
jgi:tRNA 2-thiouridine synthesizing protein A